MANMINFVGDETFKEEVLDYDKLVVVDFYADWCMPCKMLSPIFEELSGSNSDKAKFVKINVDDARDIPLKYQVTGVPSMIFFKGGREINRIVGLTQKEEIQNIIDKLA